MKRLTEKESNIEKIISELKQTRIKPSNVPELIKSKIEPLKVGTSLFDFLKRPEIKIIDFVSTNLIKPYDEEILEQAEIIDKYEGYIDKTYKEIDKMLKLEEKQIPDDIDYTKITNLASEAKQKLQAVRPITIAQATRISGVNPSDISILAIYLKKEYGKNE